MFELLVPQLSRSSPPPSDAEIAEMVAAPLTRVLVARDDATGSLIGTLTLAMFRIPTGMRAWIEDVVVDESGRGRGVGEALTRRALVLAADVGCRTVDLTSRPSREAANRLYRRIGFAERQTNVWRYALGS